MARARKRKSKVVTTGVPSFAEELLEKLTEISLELRASVFDELKAGNSDAAVRKVAKIAGMDEADELINRHMLEWQERGAKEPNDETPLPVDEFAYSSRCSVSDIAGLIVELSENSGSTVRDIEMMLYQLRDQSKTQYRYQNGKPLKELATFMAVNLHRMMVDGVMVDEEGWETAIRKLLTHGHYENRSTSEDLVNQYRKVIRRTKETIEDHVDDRITDDADGK